MASNSLAVEGAEVIAKHLSDFAPALRHIDLSDNDLCSDGTAIVMNALQQCRRRNQLNIQSLDVRHNLIPREVKEGLVAWCQAAGIQLRA